MVRGKGSEERQCIAVSEAPHRYGSLHVIWDLTELPATRQRQRPHPYPGRIGRYSIYPPIKDERLSSPPDGEFELMSYRLSTHVKPLLVLVYTEVVLRVSLCVVLSVEGVVREHWS